VEPPRAACPAAARHMAVTRRDWTPVAGASTVASIRGCRRMPPSRSGAVLQSPGQSPAGRGFLSALALLPLRECLCADRRSRHSLTVMSILLAIAGLMGAAGVARPPGWAHAGSEVKLYSAAYLLIIHAVAVVAGAAAV